jgi:oxygen-independent coproporphyrinogen-3 oxidase
MPLYSERFQVFDSLYLGGGTPTVLEDRELAALLECVHEHFTFCPGSEMTIEANPDGLSMDKLNAIRGFGINRISLGVQSLDDRDLKYLGRGHNSEQALKALEMARSCGFNDMGLDLIYGLETQSLQAWKRTVDRVLEFRPEHISCYQMTFETGAPFWKMKEAGQIRPIGKKMESALFIWTSRYLGKHGYHHYEISNFARNRKSMCRHNRKYWSHTPYLGLGPAAHSFQDGRRWWNVKSVEKYCRLLGQGIAPVESSEVLSEEQLDLEALWLGFRTCEGADLHAPGGGLRSGDTLAELEKAGLVKVRNGRMQPTRKGFLVADGMPLMFCGE